MSDDDEWDADEAVKRKVHDAIADAIAGTDSIIGWIYPDGHSATSCITSGPHYAVRGLIEEGLQHMVNAVDASGVEYDD